VSYEYGTLEVVEAFRRLGRISWSWSKFKASRRICGAPRCVESQSL